MLRVSPEGCEVWVQTASGSNVILDSRTLETLHTEEVGNQPVTVAFSPDGRYSFVSMAGESYVATFRGSIRGANLSRSPKHRESPLSWRGLAHSARFGTGAR